MASRDGPGNWLRGDGSGAPSSSAPLHPFKVGEKYRNRLGDYQVVSLDGEDMVIQYDDGSLLETTVGMQERIWLNVLADELAEANELLARSKSSSRSASRSFRGLHSGDFQDGVTGTSWRRKSDLGGLLAAKLSENTPYEFESHVVRARPVLHIARAAHYESKRSHWLTKLFLDLNETRARFGFSVAVGNGGMDEPGDWDSVLRSLADEAMQRKSEGAMRRTGLHWEIYDSDDEQMLAQIEPGEEEAQLSWQSPDQEQAELVTWAEFLSRLEALAEAEGCKLYLCSRMDKDQAIATGGELPSSLLQVYRAILPIYEVSTAGV